MPGIEVYKNATSQKQPMNPSIRDFLKRVIPFTDSLKKVFYFGVSHFCPICQSHLRLFLPAGTVTRSNALCPVCGSLERHRLVYLFMQQRTNLFLPSPKRLLHIAPEECLAKILKANHAVHYVSADLSSHAMLQMDLAGASFPDKTFDAVYASHVLEHIAQDRRAMQEIFRVLKNNGWAILLVPIGAETTYEDPAITSAEARERAFGQSDHVRIYGWDYLERLSQAGFRVQREKLFEQRSISTARRLGLIEDDEIVYCVKADRTP